jgi:hypothetical protein
MLPGTMSFQALQAGTYVVRARARDVNGTWEITRVKLHSQSTQEPRSDSFYKVTAFTNNASLTSMALQRSPRRYNLFASASMAEHGRMQAL